MRTLPGSFQEVKDRIIEEPNTGCWIWLGARDADGYGKLGRKNQRRAHRLVYELVLGPIPAGLTLDHGCRNRPCVNPMHLTPRALVDNVMLGDSQPAQNARKTHCKRGHSEWSVEGGRRRCKVCHRENEAARRAYVAAV